MSKPLLSDLADEYNELMDTCIIAAAHQDAVDHICSNIVHNTDRYVIVAVDSGVPWWAIAIIHSLEGDLDFNTHLHNGDPLSARTVHEPRDRPVVGDPPFTWEASALDALTIDNFTLWSDWSIAGTLYMLESYNGWGYRLYHGINSPYLWSFSNHYSRGKYKSDGVYDKNLVSNQAGGAVLLRRLLELSLVNVSRQEDNILLLASMVNYAAQPPSSQQSTLAKRLQIELNKLPDIYLKVDGWAGNLTSAAVRKTTGSYLADDPRQ